MLKVFFQYFHNADVFVTWLVNGYNFLYTEDEKLKAEMLGKKNIQFVIVLLSVLMYLWVFPINKAA